MRELEELVSDALAGDRSAFACLLERETPSAYRAALAILRSPEEARDVVQEAAIHAWQELPRLRRAAAWPAWFRRSCSAERSMAQHAATRCPPTLRRTSLGASKTALRVVSVGSRVSRRWPRPLSWPSSPWPSPSRYRSLGFRRLAPARLNRPHRNPRSRRAPRRVRRSQPRRRPPMRARSLSRRRRPWRPLSTRSVDPA